MARAYPKSDGWLAIKLEGGNRRYRPGDTIVGSVRRAAHVVAVTALVHVWLLGRSTSTVITRHGVGNNQRTTSHQCQYEFFDRADTLQQLHEGPVHVAPSGEEQAWPFAIPIPSRMNFKTLAKSSSRPEQSLVRLDAETIAAMPLPATCLASDGNLVEYWLTAELRVFGQGSYDSFTAIMPVSIALVSHDPPIAHFGLRRHSRRQSVDTYRLVPGMEDARLSLGQRTSMFFRSTSVPIFWYQFQTGVPSVIQIDHPSPLPIRFRVCPDSNSSSDIIRDIPQKVILKRVELQLVCSVHGFAAGLESSNSQPAELIGYDAVKKLERDLYVPCTNEVDFVDVGEVFDVRVGHRRNQHWAVNRVACPSYTTFNVKVTHFLKWSVRAEIAGEEFRVDGKQDVEVLPPSGGPEPGLSVALPPRSESWIVPPPRSESWIVPPPDDSETPAPSESAQEGK